MRATGPLIRNPTRPTEMAANEESLKQLIPFKAGPDSRRSGSGAWPGWRQALRRAIGDGESLFEKLHELAMGTPQIPVDQVTGKPMTENVYLSGILIGVRPIVVHVPPAVQRQAASELLDRAFGKPVQVVLDVTPTGSGDGDYVPVDELTEDERAIVRQIAKRRMLVKRVTEPVEPATVDVAIESDGDE